MAANSEIYWAAFNRKHGYMAHWTIAKLRKDAKTTVTAKWVLPRDKERELKLWRFAKVSIVPLKAKG